MFVRLISIILSFMVVGINYSYANDPTSKVEMVVPSPGEPIIYDASGVIFRFSGKIVSENFRCENFRFWMVGEDLEGRKALFSTNYYATDAGLINLGGKSGQVWTNRVSDGIECSTYLDQGAYIGLTKAKQDWAKIYLERHNLLSDETSVATFVKGWEYLQENPARISLITFDSLGLNQELGFDVPILQPVSFKAFSKQTKYSGKLIFKNLKVIGSQTCGAGAVCVSGRILWQSNGEELPVPGVRPQCGVTKGGGFTCSLWGDFISDNQGNFDLIIRKWAAWDDNWKKVNGKWETQFSINAKWGGMEVKSQLSFTETDQSEIKALNEHVLKVAKKVVEVKAGLTCQIIGSSTRVSNDNFTCIKNGAKKVWKKTGYWVRTCKQIAYPNPARCVGRLADCINGDTREFLYRTACSERFFKV